MSKAKKIEKMAEKLRKEGMNVVSDSVEDSSAKSGPHIKIRGFSKIASDDAKENEIMKGSHSKTPTVEDLASLMSEFGHSVSEFREGVDAFKETVKEKLSDHESRIIALEEKINPRKAASESTPEAKDKDDASSSTPSSGTKATGSPVVQEPDPKVSSASQKEIDLTKCNDIIIDIYLPNSMRVEFH